MYHSHTHSTSPSPTVATLGHTEIGESSGMTNSNDFGPCASTAPLMTALFSRLSFGLQTVMVVVDVSLTGVAAKLMTFSDNSRAGSIPTP